MDLDFPGRVPGSPMRESSPLFVSGPSSPLHHTPAMPLPPRRFGPPRVSASPSRRHARLLPRRSLVLLVLRRLRSSSSPSARVTPRGGGVPAPGLVAAAPSSLPEPPALVAVAGPLAAVAPRSFVVRPESSTLSLFEERALRADVRHHAHDAALAREQIREMNPRLRALERVSEELADLKAAAMTSTTQLAEAKSRFRRQDQDLQRFRAQLRLAEQKAEYCEKVHKDGEGAAHPTRDVLVERLRVAEAETARSKKGTHAAAVLLGREEDTAADLRNRVAGLERELASADSWREALVEHCRAANADVLRIKAVLEQAKVAITAQRLQIDGPQARVAELQKEVETRSKVSVRDYNRLVDDKLLLQEELHLLREEMDKLHQGMAARLAEQAELADVRSQFAEQTRMVQHHIDTLVDRRAAVRRLEADRDLLRAELTSSGSGALLARNAD
ncbi:MAG: hypothetical protein M1826_006145 [Phylliscum demangeonii]|nr:MAG: hypothetical protein M1826_006145 [Phylliscum demangeonii]